MDNPKPQTSSNLTGQATLTPVEQRAYDLMEEGEWYCENSLKGAKELPYSIRRRAHVLECLREKGYLESVVKFSIPGNFYSTYRLYRKPVSEGKQASTAPSKQKEDLTSSPSPREGSKREGDVS